MSPDFIADSSVGIAWVILSQSGPETDRLAEDLKTGRAFMVPALWTFEVANALLVLRRRHRLEKHAYEQALKYLSEVSPVVDDEGARLALGDTSKLAAKYDLSVYDAVYLELALRRGLPLATRNAALNNAAVQAGVRTLL